MSDILNRIEITKVDGPYDTWTRTVDFDYEGISYRVTLDHHEKNGIFWQWFDKSNNKIEAPTWLSDDDGDFYWDLANSARE